MGTTSLLCSHFVTNMSVVGPLNLYTSLNEVGTMKAIPMLYILDHIYPSAIFNHCMSFEYKKE